MNEAIASNISIWIPDAKRVLILGGDTRTCNLFRSAFPGALLETDFHGMFDVIVLASIPLERREATMRTVKTTLSCGGHLIFTDWITRPNVLIRMVAGHQANYYAAEDVIDLTRKLFGVDRITGHVAAWRKRVVLHVQTH